MESYHTHYLGLVFRIENHACCFLDVTTQMQHNTILVSLCIAYQDDVNKTMSSAYANIYLIGNHTQSIE